MQLNNKMSGVQARAEREAAEDTILRLLDQRTSGWLIAESPPLGSLSLSLYLYVHHSPPVSQIFTISIRELHFSWPKRAIEIDPKCEFREEIDAPLSSIFQKKKCSIFFFTHTSSVSVNTGYIHTHTHNKNTHTTDMTRSVQWEESWHNRHREAWMRSP